MGVFSGGCARHGRQLGGESPLWAEALIQEEELFKNWSHEKKEYV
jgi:hypothetical protein